nr:hypothetical protein [Chloroflexota bacterium]
YGYVAPNVLEADLERYFPYLVTLFARLPYVRPVRIAHSPSELGRPSALGLQWAPRVEVREPRVAQLQFA